MSPAKPTAVKAVAMTAPGTMELRSYPFPQLDRDSAILQVDMTMSSREAWIRTGGSRR